MFEVGRDPVGPGGRPAEPQASDGEIEAGQASPMPIGIQGRWASARPASEVRTEPGDGLARGTSAVGSKFCQPNPGNQTCTQAWASLASTS